MGVLRRSLDFLAPRPWIDLLCMLATGVLIVWLVPVASGIEQSSRDAIFNAVAAYAGLTLAAATFACGLVYSSATALVVKARQFFANELKRNWTSILAITFGSGMLALIGMIIDSVAARISQGLIAVALVGLSCCVVRIIYWVRYVLFAEELDSGDRSTAEPPYANSHHYLN